MPYNGAGVFTGLPTPIYPAVAGEFILAEYFNDTMEDVFQGLSSVITIDGQNAPTVNLPMAGFKLLNLGDGSSDTDSVNFGQVFHSPTFDGFPKTSTPAPTDSSMQIANTAWVGTQLLNIGTSASYKGPWASLTGALAIPATVTYNGGYYFLTENVADVSLYVPGTSDKWVWLNPDRSLRNSLLWS